MIELTVRTLDSQNHPFTVEDDITVAQFKQKIAETVNIPPETQRIIYCGRVLTDESKLSEFDVNGKVVHLVERAPPSENQRANNANRTHSPQPQRVLGGNAMYLGSMAIPLESQNLVPPPPSHSLAASRLNVARRMLRRAEAVIHLLENPTARPSDVTPAEEPQEEVTPVFEARVIVPSESNGPIDETYVLNTVQNSLINATSIPGSSQEQGETSTAAAESTESQPMAQGEAESESPPARSASSTPEGVSPISTSTEDLAAESRGPAPSGSSRRTLAENASRTSEMADLLETLGRLQARFAPFLERYQNFMREDPVVGSEDVRRTQAMMNRVSEVLHFLGHAYHSLSDIIIRVRNSPPRPLLCRPILIQHSAVLQAGIPIQVEAQISFAPDNNGTPTTNGNAPSAPSADASSAQTNTTQTPPSQPTQQRPTIGQNISMNPNIWSLPLLPPSGVHVQSFPIGIRTMRPNSANRQSAQNSAANNNSNQNQNQPNPAGNNATANSNNPAEFGNPNVEFFMEVSPESITIDSLETTLLGGMRAGGAPPPEVLQSIVQIASHLVSRGATNVNFSNISRQPRPAQQTEASTNQLTSSQSTPSAVPGQNSQARGNTQTHPTTATHTRSTSRPHVHLAQHAMQGFDPFLPCNSHHVNYRRRNQAQSRNNNSNRAQQNAEGNQGVGHPIGVEEIVQDLVNSLQSAYTQGRRQPANAPAGQNQNAQTGQNSSPQAGQTQGAQAAGGAARSVFIDYSSLPMHLPNIQRVNMSEVGSRGPTLDQLVSSDNYGDGVFGDLIRFLLRNLTVLDTLQLFSGRMDILLHLRNDIRQFIIDSILDGNPTPANIERGANRIITAMQPFLEDISQLPIREDIDIIRSIQMLMRARLLNILNLAVSRSPNSMKIMIGQLRILLRHLGGLILYANTNGARGFEEFAVNFLRRYVRQDDLQPTLGELRFHLQQFIATLNVPVSSLQVYIVKKVDAVTDYSPVPMDLDPPVNEVDLDQASGSTSVLINLNDSSEDLPSVIVGSEPWHNQVPSDWVPIITRDTQRQRRQNQQSPLSDAYLAGMPSKRRKIVASNKPQGSLPQVIAESIRRAVTASGLSTVGNVEAVAQEAGADLNIQSAYRDLLRTRVQSSIQDNEDFTPDRFPNASNYFNKSQ